MPGGEVYSALQMGVIDGVEHDGVLGHVRRHQAERAALGEASGGEATGETTDVVLEFGVGVAGSGEPADQSDPVRVIAGIAEDVFGEGHLGNHDIGQWAGEDM